MKIIKINGPYDATKIEEYGVAYDFKGDQFYWVQMINETYPTSIPRWQLDMLMEMQDKLHAAIEKDKKDNTKKELKVMSDEIQAIDDALGNLREEVSFVGSRLDRLVKLKAAGFDVDEIIKLNREGLVN